MMRGRTELVGLLLVAAVSALATPSGGTPAHSPKPVRVLFIGNSYTYVNNLPELVRGLAAGMAEPVAVEVEQVTVGGATLRRLWEAGPALAAIREARWDYVVLQEQSTFGVTMVNGRSVVSDPARLFWPAARLFDAAIRKAGARTVLMNTWGAPGRAESFQALAHGQFTIGRELGAAVVPAGLAWQRALAERADLPLYMVDGSHPAPAGSYLMALATVATLLDRVPASPPLAIQGHRTGVDGNPEASLGTLAAIDSATGALFRRVVTGLRREIEAAGGYLAIAEPPRPTPPAMPAGRPLPAGGLLGTWSGTLQLFNVAGGQEITLELRPAGAAYIGVATIALDPVIREAGLEVSVDGREVRFSIASPIDRGLPIRFRGVLVAENRLEGRATITSDELGWDLSGVWTATRH
jgi:hypothetical protein